MKIRFICAGLLMMSLLAGCHEDGPEPAAAEALDCGPGRSATIEGVRACVIDNALLIETGFECGAGLERYEGDQVTICAEAPLSQAQLSGVEGFEAPEDPMTPILLSDINQGECVNELEVEVTPALRAELLGGGEVSIEHVGVGANCCAMLRGGAVTPDFSARTLSVTYDFDESDPCDCNCIYTLDYSIFGVPPGAWTIQAGPLSAQIGGE